MKKIGITIATGLIISLSPALPAEAARAGGIYANCNAFNKVYPSGVGMRNAADWGPAPQNKVRNFVRKNKVYKKAIKRNRSLDRDRDRIACERLTRTIIKSPTKPPIVGGVPGQQGPQGPKGDPVKPPNPPKATHTIDITTRHATAYGDKIDDNPNFVFKPVFNIAARVECPKGLAAWMEVPVFSHTKPGEDFTCTGQPQQVEFAWAAAPTTPGTAKVPATVTLATSEGRVSDTQDIYITTRFR